MKTPVSLYEFMPYGAPELIESRQAHMLRALGLATALAVAVFGAGGRLATLIPEAPPVLNIPTHHVSRDPSRPPLLQMPEAPAAAPRVRVEPDAGVPLPVPDSKAPPETRVAADPDVLGAAPDATIGAGEVSEATRGTAPEPPLPGIDDYVYVEELPVPVKQIVPAYPEIARDAGVEGLVMVKVLVGKDGRVLDVWLDPKHEIPMLNDAAMSAARKWVFKPAFANGKPVPVWTAIPFNFVLR
jgi:protein TonB